MKTLTSTTVQNFSNQVEEVQKLSTFDEDILSMVIASLNDLSNNLIKAGVDNPYLSPDRIIQMLSGIKSHRSLKHRYQTINNHSVVLLVSYFASAIGELFNSTIDFIILNGLPLPKKLEKEEIKFSISDLNRYGYDLNNEIGNIIARKSDISFQDMQSISRSFTNYIEVTLDWNDYDFVHNIIAGQACRHAIVHNAEIADQSCIGQLRSAKKRTIVSDLTINDRIILSSEDITIVGQSMVEYIEVLVDKINEKYPDNK